MCCVGGKHVVWVDSVWYRWRVCGEGVEHVVRLVCMPGVQWCVW